MQIRRATAADVDALFALYRQLSSPDTPLTRERLTATFATVEARGAFEVWVAVRGDAMIGTFMLAILEALGARCRPLAIVEDVVVEVSERGRGVGKAMMHFAMERARAAECYKLMLSSNEKREEAHRFYESLGFERHGFSFVCDLR